MGILDNIFNGVVDIVKLAIIAVFCLVVIFIGGYLLGDLVGLIPEATGLHRTLSFQTFMTDLPYIGNNMIYVIIGMALLVLVYLGIEIYERKRTTEEAVQPEKNEKEPAAPAGTAVEMPAEPVAPKAKQ